MKDEDKPSAFELLRQARETNARLRGRAAADHAATLLALVAHGVFCEECPLPWSAEKLENFDGKGGLAWAIRDVTGQALAYLDAAEVDGEAFVDWVNAYATKVAATELALTRLSARRSS